MSRGRAGGAGGVLVAVLLAGALAGAGCGVDISQTPPPPGPLPTPLPSLTLPIESTRAALVAALARVDLVLEEALEGYRPAESPALQRAARGVFKVRLPADPAALFVVVYQFADATTAAGAGQEMARYLGSGPGLVQFPPGARFALSQFNETLVFAAWSPDATDDDETARAAFDAIAAFGLPIPITR